MNPSFPLLSVLLFATFCGAVKRRPKPQQGVPPSDASQALAQSPPSSDGNSSSLGVTKSLKKKVQAISQQTLEQSEWLRGRDLAVRRAQAGFAERVNSWRIASPPSEDSLYGISGLFDREDGTSVAPSEGAGTETVNGRRRRAKAKVERQKSDKELRDEYLTEQRRIAVQQEEWTAKNLKGGQREQRVTKGRRGSKAAVGEAVGERLREMHLNGSEARGGGSLAGRNKSAPVLEYPVRQQKEQHGERRQEGGAKMGRSGKRGERRRDPATVEKKENAGNNGERQHQERQQDAEEKEEEQQLALPPPADKSLKRELFNKFLADQQQLVSSNEEQLSEAYQSEGSPSEHDHFFDAEMGQGMENGVKIEKGAQSERRASDEDEFVDADVYDEQSWDRQFEEFGKPRAHDNEPPIPKLGKGSEGGKLVSRPQVIPRRHSDVGRGRRDPEQLSPGGLSLSGSVSGWMKKLRLFGAKKEEGTQNGKGKHPNGQNPEPSSFPEEEDMLLSEEELFGARHDNDYAKYYSSESSEWDSTDQKGAVKGSPKQNKANNTGISMRQPKEESPFEAEQRVAKKAWGSYEKDNFRFLNKDHSL